MAAELMPCARRILLCLPFILAACGTQSREIHKIALLAPFEGEYRAVGYNALYAMRLALADSAVDGWQMLAVDDGGSVESATDRMRALNLDPAVRIIAALGAEVTHPQAQNANDKPLLLIGNWGHALSDSDSHCVCHASPAMAAAADDLYLAEYLSGLLQQTQATELRSGGALPDADFASRYRAIAPHTPKPNWLATLTYDIARFALQAGPHGIRDGSYDGINGRIQFDDGYWSDAPRRSYQFRDGELYALDA